METVLITGASSGIGEACARAFRERGHKLVLLARRKDRLDRLAAELGGSEIVVADVRDSLVCEDALKGLPSSHREISIFVNNAGLALGIERAQKVDASDWETMIDVNVRAFSRLSLFVLRQMVERNRGHLVHLGSVAGTYPYAGGNVYGASKAFVEQFSLNLRADLHGTRVRVTNIEPGMVQTEFSDVRFKGDQEKASAVYRGVDALTAGDVAEVIRFSTELPERVNLNRIEMMPTAQAFAGFTFDRKTV